VFNLPAPTGGNYWSNWCPPLHPDSDEDGFVDEPYVIVIDELNPVQDNLPWVVQDGWLMNQPPVADAGPDQTVEQDSHAGASVTLDGSGSSDPDGDTLTYSWTWAGGSASGVNPTVVLPLGTTTVTLTVSDGQLSDTDTVDITIEDTTPPMVDAGPDIEVEQETWEGTEVTLSASATVSDICDPSPTIVWSQGPTAVFPLGSTVVMLTATDASGNSASDTVVVTVVDTTPPEITCPADVTVKQKSCDSTVVPLAATATDICDPNPVITSDELPIYPLGETVVTFTATDASGNSASCSMSVTVLETTPPTISKISASPEVLWPPNHRMVPVFVFIEAIDICTETDKLTLVVTAESSEPDDYKGDGAFTGDVDGEDGFTTPVNLSGVFELVDGVFVGVFELRAERDGRRTGRVYTIHVKCMDASGNIAEDTVKVTVPHDKGKGKKDRGRGKPHYRGKGKKGRGKPHDRGKGKKGRGRK